MESACDRCGGSIDELGVCRGCGRHLPLTARERIAILCTGFEEQDASLAGDDPLRFPDYQNAVYAARVESGLTEAAVWGWTELGGILCALVVLDFRFLGGSMGVAVGEKVARALDGAREQRAPLVAVTASGGARMQEGMASLVQMAKTTEARRKHADAGLAMVTLLTSPTTGGVYASFASLADVVFAEPGAHVGFAGPRVVQILTGQSPNPEAHTAEFAFEHGMVDGILARPDQRERLGRTLRALTGTRASPAPPRAASPAPKEGGASVVSRSAWDRLELTRDRSRPHSPDLMDVLLTGDVELHGDRTGGDDRSVIVRIGVVAATGRPVVCVGQDASADPGRIAPEGFRKASRSFELAGRLGLPVVTLIDTRGAEPGTDAEAAGVASAIAHAMQGLLACSSPTLAVVIGEGGSGGALAMAAADRVLAWENAVFSVIAPRGAAAILYRDADRGPELAEQLRITSADLQELGMVDEIVAEPPRGAQSDPGAAVPGLCRRIAAVLEELCERDDEVRRLARSLRWRDAANRWLRIER